ncbi:MAG TPA: carboxypeptidase regulatory-like domain-containing protein [Candidatus Acidoferrales bacterium]|nr:carboxypeptidase regulatory-like domain-containing protein [Candidatus Acidoferrales bacterium]
MRNVLGLLTISFILATSLFGQTTSLNGTVTDPTGAAIPNAAITIANVQTGTQRTTTSDSQGRYTMPQLTPGTYRLTAKVAGFADVTINEVELLVNEPATVPLVFGKLGETSTTITVESAATQVNTTDASLGNVITSEAIVELPMFARNIVGLLASQPGVTIFGSAGAGANGTNNLDSRSGSVNGGKSDQANVTLDGADVNDQNARTAFTTVLRVTPDSVEEFRSVTTNGDAATGRGSGADVALITKSGTNQLHGSLYEFRRGTETSANSFFNNRSGVKNPPLLINLFGGTVGGPIKKNKAFFFLNYEGRRDRSATSVSRTVPTASMQQGILFYHDANKVLQQVGPAQIKQLDPAGIGISAAGLALMNTMPAGNDNTGGDGLNTTGYRFNSPVASDQNTYIAKLDYKLDNAGKHSLFWRGNLQNDSANGTPQFPGQPPNSVTLSNNKGFAAGWTGVLTNSIVNTFRYGFTRVGNQTTGVLTSPYEWFRGIDTPFGTSTGTTRIIPVHTIGNDLSWNHGAHDFRFGGIVRLVSNQSASLSNSYSNSSSNPSWLTGSGNDLTGSLSITSGDLQSFEYGMGALLGIQAQGTGKYNYQVDGTVIAPGAPVLRNFISHEGEVYAQDTWKVTRNLTVTAGLRFSHEPPVYEANGQQASTNIPIAQWLGDRVNLADQGLSQNGVTPITFIPGSSGRPMYPTHNNWAPRLGIAYSPKAEGGLSKFLFGGPGKTSIRVGGGMYYDIIGQPLAQAFSGSQFGLSSSLSNPPNTLSTAQAPRFTTFFTVPGQLVPPTPKGGLPVTYPASGSGSFAITNSIDDNLKAPYTMNLDFSIGRDFGHGFFVQGSYVGRLSRHSLVNRDLAEPTDLRDPKSGQDYFSAIAQMATMLDLQGVTIANLPKIPFFENMWSTAATGGLTATQVWALDYHGDPTRGIKGNSNQGDFTNTLNNADNAGNCGKTTVLKASGAVSQMACGIYGPWMVFNPQFSALSAFSSLGKGDYHGMQWTIRKRFSGGLLFDVNYTWSKSIDLASTAENGGSSNPNATASFTGFIINTFNPSQMRGVSSYDTTHAVNANFVYDLPFGRGRRFGGNMNKVLDAIVGGWEVTGLYRQTSGLPFNVINGQRWPTNWNLGGNATPNGQPIPQVVSTGNATGIVGGGPNLWDNPAAAFAAFREDFAGESGGRTNLRGQGLFNIDSGVYKSFTMPWSEHQKLTFRWESYNLTNSVRFDPTSGAASGNSSSSTISSSSFGKLTTQLGAPRQMQFALRFAW